jgi:hypothetical protein
MIITKSICIKESQVIYRMYNSRTAGPILMISDLLYIYIPIIECIWRVKVNIFYLQQKKFKGKI